MSVAGHMHVSRLRTELQAVVRVETMKGVGLKHYESRMSDTVLLMCGRQGSVYGLLPISKVLASTDSSSCAKVV